MGESFAQASQLEDNGSRPESYDRNAQEVIEAAFETAMTVDDQAETDSTLNTEPQEDTTQETPTDAASPERIPRRGGVRQRLVMAASLIMGLGTLVGCSNGPSVRVVERDNFGGNSLNENPVRAGFDLMRAASADTQDRLYAKNNQRRFHRSSGGITVRATPGGVSSRVYHSQSNTSYGRATGEDKDDYRKRINGNKK